jgi:hypothetical protein
MARVVQALLKAKRIVVICGAWQPHGLISPASSFDLIFSFQVLESLCKLEYQTFAQQMVCSEL